MTQAVKMRGHEAVLRRLTWDLASTVTRGHGDHDGEVLQPRAQPTHVQQVLVTGAAEHHLQVPEAGVGDALPGLLRPRVQDNPSQQVESSDL